MTDLHQHARELRDRGWSYKAIADELGVGVTTAHRWVNPDSHERHLAAGRAWKKQHPSTCELCGSEKPHDPNRPRCVECVQSIADIRASVIVGMWEDGWAYSEIGTALGWADPNAVGSALTRLRRRGLIGYRQPDHWRVAA